MIEPLRVEVDLAYPQEHAVATWTEHFARWWPRAHTVTGFAYRWRIRRDRADATDVEIRFVATGDKTTRMEITHTGWERLGAEAESWRDANCGGWAGLLPHFIAACTPSTAHEEEHAS